MTPVEAAGGLLWRPTRHGPEVGLVHRPKYDDWSLPKGKLEAAEHPLLGALREVHEEAGCRVRAGRPLGEIRYTKDGRPKRVRYWALQHLTGAFSPNDEVDELAWLRPDQARERLSPDRDRPVLDEFLAHPHVSWPVVLLRHARAGDRSTWRGDDDLRPLDTRGRAQATALARLLSAYDPRRLVSADLTRCLDTLRPAAAALGLPVEPSRPLSARGHAEAPARALAALRALVEEQQPVVVCTQRGPLPALAEQLAAELGAPLGLDLPAKGTAVVLHVAADPSPRLLATELLAG